MCDQPIRSEAVICFATLEILVPAASDGHVQQTSEANAGASSEASCEMACEIVQQHKSHWQTCIKREKGL